MAKSNREKRQEAETKILNEIVVKESNILALSPRDRILHPNETKLLMWIFYQYQKQGKNDLSISFTYRDFADYFHILESSGYKFLDKWTDGIMKLNYFFKNPKTEQFEKVVLIPTVKYKEGVLKVEFHHAVFGHLLNLNKNYISIGLDILKDIKNPRFLRMYEWLKAKIFDGHCRSETISLEALYKLLIVKENTYPLFHNFKRKVLNPVLKELCKTDLKVEVEYLRTGRKITHLRFTCANNREMIKQNDSKKYCPSCKIRSVILKTSPQGDFWGCENYPRCKFKTNIKPQKVETKQKTTLNNKKTIIEDNYLQNAFAEIVNSKKDFEEDYLTTNYKAFDQYLHGIKKNTFNIIFGKTSAGKTAFVLNLMMRLRKRNAPIRAVFCSLEMNKYDVDRRLLSIVSHVPLDKIEKEQQKVQTALKHKNNFITVDDEKQTDLDTLIKKIKNIHQQKPIDLAIVDYLQILSSKTSQNNYQTVSQAARSLQKLSTELKITIIAVSQINRAGDVRSTYQPLALNDIQDSSVIAQSADLVIALQSASKIRKNEILCNILKNRNGSSKKIIFNFNRQNMVFSELAPLE